MPYIVRKRKVATTNNQENREEQKPASTTNLKDILNQKRKVDILNSFYLRDLEKAALHTQLNNSEQVQYKATPLNAYLNLNSRQEYFDIFSKSNTTVLNQYAQVDKIPDGRWPSNPQQQLSLNQQLAINYYFSNTSNLVAINGPPGTGKTTLVRDLIAGLIVERAKVLAQLKRPEQAFTGKIQRFDSANGTILTRDLIPALKGFEILIASSNNNAVENISKVLPHKEALGKDFLNFTYIKPVADLLTFLNAKSASGIKPDVTKHSISNVGIDSIWGLPSVALGNRKNRKKFRNAGFFGMPGETENEQLERIKYGQLTFAEWRSTHNAQALSFNMAKKKFLDCLYKLNNYKQHKLSHQVVLPEDIRDYATQIAAPALNSEFNLLRSELLLSAFALHETWVREVPRLEIELNALKTLLKSPQRHTAAVNAMLWPILFMLVPVVSSTLASVETMFSKLPAETLGHVIIDEAGQAVPQSAVGILFRAKRALIIGDQRQLEPICLLPKTLEQYLGNKLSLQHVFHASPLSSSVQSLADRQSALGTYFSDGIDKTWVGLPLCVHRRCYEPMFSIANNIAYDGIMISAIKDAQPNESYLGGSAWFQVKGTAVKKQWVTEQGQLASDLLLELIKQHNDLLPDVFLISPFRRVRAELRITLGRALKQAGYVKYVRELRRRIGTVHTFQGKEADIVFFVLGCDENTSLAADWAGAKPNLINVAVTRARKYLYVLGDLDIWHNKGYFSDLEKYMRKVYEWGKSQEV